MKTLAPIVLGPNPASQAYPGAGLGARFRGIEPGPTPEPEDWIASVTARWQQAPSGLSRLPDGRLLHDAVVEDPESYLGPDHVAAFGDDPALLVKLLDSSERLVVHCHPDRAFARTHLGCAHGKTESWLVLDAGPGAEVYLGFTRAVERAELDQWVAGQDVEAMLSNLRAVPVETGSALLVPAGVPHAIGARILIVELQEPTDFSVMLEQGRFTGGDLGLGFDVALGCVDRNPWTAERVAGLVGPGLAAEGTVLPAAAAPFFRVEHVRAASGGDVGAGYAVLIAIGGSGSIRGDFPGGAVEMRRGSTVLLPHGAGPVRADGDLDLVVCRPPSPGPLEPSRPEV